MRLRDGDELDLLRPAPDRGGAGGDLGTDGGEAGGDLGIWHGLFGGCGAQARFID
jgi:hypothetical protein